MAANMYGPYLQLQPLVKDEAKHEAVQYFIAHLIWLASGYSTSNGSRRTTHQVEESSGGSSQGAFQHNSPGSDDGVEGDGGSGSGAGRVGASVPAADDRRIVSVVVKNYDDSVDQETSLDITDIATLLDFYESLHNLYVNLGFGNRYHEDLYRMYPWLRFNLSYFAEDGTYLHGQCDDRDNETTVQLQRRWRNLKGRLHTIIAKKAHPFS